MTSLLAGTTLGSIVASDHRTAPVFEGFGLDFCCGGKRTLEEACSQRGISVAAVDAALRRLGPTAVAPNAKERADATWPAAELTQFIVRRHHTYVREQLPVVAAYLAKLNSVHGQRHPELLAVASHFARVAEELQMHLKKEEEILFPYICALEAAAESGGEPPPNMFGTVTNPIRMMEAEHKSAGDELELVRALTGNFTVPDDGCATYRVCFEELEAFDRDLRMHIHLENNILFPKAIALEASIAGAPDGVRPRVQISSHQ